MSESRKHLPILLGILFFILGVLAGVLINTDTSSLSKTFSLQNSSKNTVNTPVNDKIDLTLFWEAYDKTAKNYYGFDNISQDEIVAGMIKGFIDSLGDKHSEYFNVEEREKFNEALTGDFEGIGAVIQKNDFGVIVEQIIAGSPAKEAGILSGDIIIKANGTELKDLSLPDAVSKIRGPANTKVDLEIVRSGEKQILQKSVVRKKINVPSVDSKVLDNNLGYIILSIYGKNTGEEFQKALKDLYQKNISGLIIDLRDNGGGYLETSVDILSNFVDKDRVLVSTKEKNPLGNESFFSYGNDLKDIPVVILINGNSASASEITAGALQDYGLAVLVGEKTYGKGSVQKEFVLQDGSEMKITIAKWYTPKDHGIDKVGISPDVPVVFQKEDFEKKYDRQLEKAKEVLSKYIELKDREKTVEFFKKQQELLLKEQTAQTLSGSVSDKK